MNKILIYVILSGSHKLSGILPRIYNHKYTGSNKLEQWSKITEGAPRLSQESKISKLFSSLCLKIQC